MTSQNAGSSGDSRNHPVDGDGRNDISSGDGRNDNHPAYTQNNPAAADPGNKPAERQQDSSSNAATSEFVPLEIAAGRGHIDVVRTLLDAGADVNYARNKSTPMFVAAGAGHLEVVKLLHSRGADLDPPDEADNKPIYRAAYNGHTEVVRYLAAHDPNLDRLCAGKAWTPLSAGVAQHHPEVIKVLLIAGADPNTKCANGMTALYLASRDGLTEIVDTLLQYGAKPN